MKFNNKSFNPHNTMRGFTLIELLVVLALIAILTVVIIVAIKPTEIFKKSRDTQRIGDLKNIDKVFNVIYSTDPTFNELNYFSPNTVYLSLRDNSSTCGSFINDLPPLPSGWSYHCSATPTNIDGSGWLTGLNFNNFPIINLVKLPIDPINKPPYYYSFVAGGSYKLTAKPEINYGPAINDGGFEPLLYEVGSDLKLSTFQSGLVLYLPFDEGTGTTAKDSSGFGNNGTLYSGSSICSNPPTSGCPQWTTGKVGGALSFDGVDDYVSVLDDTLPLGNQSHTIIAWINPAKICNNCMTIFYYGANANNQLRLFFFRSNSLAGAFYANDFTSGLTPATNTWQFAVWRWDNSTGKESIFLNLDKSERTTSGVNTPNLTYGYIGGVYATWWWQGLIDEVRIYNRALTDQEIKALYEATK